jgi:outer membrane lipoprotein SlyB
MRKRLLATILSAGLLLGTAAPAQSARQRQSVNARSQRHHRRGRGSAARRIGTGALGGAAIGGLMGGGRGALIGGAVGAGAGGIHHRRRNRVRQTR